MKDKEFLTVAHRGSARFEEKKSVFLAAVSPVSTEQEALDFLASIRSEHPTATHNVYAYHVVDENNMTVQRYSDDGEPSGTSGIPVLDSFRKKNLCNMIVVVTRYFGGTLLGASGLVRSYGKAASLGIQDAGMIKRMLAYEITITCEYSMLGRLQNRLAEKEISILHTEYTQDVELTVAVPSDDVDDFMSDMVDVSNDNVLLEKGECRYLDIPIL